MISLPVNQRTDEDHETIESAIRHQQHLEIFQSNCTNLGILIDFLALLYPIIHTIPWKSFELYHILKMYFFSTSQVTLN